MSFSAITIAAVAIVLGILLNGALNRARKLGDKLWSEGRISKDEYKELTNRYPVSIQQISTQIQRKTEEIEVTGKAKAYKTIEHVIIAKPKKESRERFGAIQLILAIGVLFVLIAGFIFTTATWNMMSELPRLLLLGVQTSIFFIVAEIANKKFKLPVTSNAFYILGCVFTFICTMAAGMFGLMGAWLSSSNMEAVLSLSFLMLAITSTFGIKKYKSRLFVWSAGLSYYLMIFLGALQITQMIEIACLIAGILACGVMALVIIKDKVNIPENLKKSLDRFTVSSFMAVGVISTLLSLLVDKQGNANGVIILINSIIFLVFVTWLCKEEKIKHMWALHSFVALWCIHNCGELLFGNMDANKLFQVAAIVALFWIYEFTIKKDNRLAIMSYKITLPLKAIGTLLLYSCTIETALAMTIIFITVVILGTREKNKVSATLCSIGAIVLSWITFATYATGCENLFEYRSIAFGNTMVALYLILMFGLTTASIAYIKYGDRFNANSFKLPALIGLIGYTLFGYQMSWEFSADLAEFVPMLGMLLILIHCGCALLTRDKTKRLIFIPILSGITSLGVVIEVMRLIETLSTNHTYIKDEVKLLVLAIYGTIMLGASTIRYMVKSKNNSTYQVYNVMFIIMSQALLALGSLAFLLTYTKDIWIGMTILSIMILNYGFLYKQKKSIFAFVPALGFQVVTYEIAHRIIGSGSTFELWLSFSIMMACLLGTRLLYSEKRFAWLKITAIFTPVMWIQSSIGHYDFVGWLLLSVCALQFVKQFRETEDVDRAIFSAATIPLAMALWTQRFIVYPDIIWAEIQVAILLVLVVSNWRVFWAKTKFNEVCSWVVFGTAILSTFILGADALSSGDVIDALILSTLAVVILVMSCVIRQKRWFALAVTTLIAEVLYQTAGFWASIAWWIYLLVIGIILISIAAVNEGYKQKGSNVKKKVLSLQLFDSWIW